jgi:hypothetical protein
MTTLRASASLSKFLLFEQLQFLHFNISKPLHFGSQGHISDGLSILHSFSAVFPQGTGTGMLEYWIAV